jgi:hypothetical protein
MFSLFRDCSRLSRRSSYLCLWSCRGRSEGYSHVSLEVSKMQLLACSPCSRCCAIVLWRSRRVTFLCGRGAVVERVAVTVEGPKIQLLSFSYVLPVPDSLSLLGCLFDFTSTKEDRGARGGPLYMLPPPPLVCFCRVGGFSWLRFSLSSFACSGAALGMLLSAEAFSRRYYALLFVVAVSSDGCFTLPSYADGCNAFDRSVAPRLSWASAVPFTFLLHFVVPHSTCCRASESW